MAEKKICGSRLRKKPGKFCQQTVLMPNGRCRIHGGKSPRGFAHPSFKDGRHSRDLPTRMAADYAQAREDEKLLELRDEIALVHARVLDLLKRVDSGESGHLWEKLGDSYARLVTAIREQDTEIIGIQLRAVGDLITRGTNDYRAWEETTRQIDRKQRLVESERRRAVELQQIATAEQFLMFTAVYEHATRKVIKDARLLAELQSELTLGFRERGVAVPDGVDPEQPDTVH